jgi:peptidoglycan/LPS O-acetylase OafA/YrhL
MVTQAISNERAVAPAAAARSAARVSYLDNLRILLTTLVVLHHLAIGYGAAGDWYYNEDGPIAMVSVILMTLFIAINQSFFMGMFFMMSSYVTPGSVERKGAGKYLVDRLKRLGIPLLFYTFAIQPLLVYALRLYRGDADALTRPPAFGVGPMWFVEALLVFSAAYVLWRLITPSRAAAMPELKETRAPGNAAIALFALALGLVTFVVRIWFPAGFWLEPLHQQIAHFPQYIALFVVGIVAYRRRWLEGLTPRQGKQWMWVAVFLVPLFFVIGVAGGALEGNVEPLMGGLHWQALAYAMWEQVMGVAVIVTLLALFRSRFNQQGSLARTLSGNTYAVYIFHAPVIVLLALALSGIRIEMSVKFFLVAPVALALTFAVGHFVRKLPLARNIL